MAANDLRMSPHLRLTWGGTIGVPAVEQWANSLHLVNFDDGDLPDDEELQQALNDCSVAISDWFTSAAMGISSAVGLTWAKLNRLDEFGHQPSNTIRHDYSPTVFGASNSPADWNQTYAITLRTGKQRGRAHSGRIFPPVLTMNPEGKTPYISAADASNLSAMTGMLLRQIKIACAPVFGSGGTFYPAVVSPGVRSKGTQEVREMITAAVVDRVPDTQHRRTAQVARLEGATYPIDYEL